MKINRVFIFFVDFIISVISYIEMNKLAVSVIVIVLLILIFYMFNKKETMVAPAFTGQSAQVYSECVTSCGDPSYDKMCYNQCKELAIGR